jgi:4-hydroxy-tetrahydrodipicolinate synthase
VNWTFNPAAGSLVPMNHIVTGLYVPLITPFTRHDRLATDALEALAHHVIDDGAAGIVALGTTAETATLSIEERHTVLDICGTVCGERSVPLIAGAGSNDTGGSVRALRELTAWPEITAALAPVPYFTRPGEDGVVAHFTRLAAESPVPLIIYNIPYRTGQVLGWQALRRLASVPGIIGFKHAVGGVDADTVRFMAGLPDGFAVLAGDDVFVAPMLALGAAGAIIASAHVCTRRFVELIDAWRCGRLDHGRALGHELATLSAALFAGPNPSVVKAVLHAQRRIPSPAVRLPLLDAGPGVTEAALREVTALREPEVSLGRW